MDPVVGVKQQFNMLVNSGRINEAQQLKQEMEIMLLSTAQKSQMKTVEGNRKWTIGWKGDCAHIRTKNVHKLQKISKISFQFVYIILL